MSKRPVTSFFTSMKALVSNNTKKKTGGNDDGLINSITKRNSTELSNHTWEQHDHKVDFNNKRSIIQGAEAYDQGISIAIYD